MTNLRIMLTGESAKAHAILSTQENINLVSNLEEADFVLQDAKRYRAQYTPGHMPPHDLTRRELEVLRLTAEGHSVRQVAGMLLLSAKTVDAHKVNLMRKLHIHNKAHLVQYAFRHHILSLDQPVEKHSENAGAYALLN